MYGVLVLATTLTVGSMRLMVTVRSAEYSSPSTYHAMKPSPSTVRVTSSPIVHSPMPLTFSGYEAVTSGSKAVSGSNSYISERVCVMTVSPDW